jgi:hypothetical protein
MMEPPGDILSNFLKLSMAGRFRQQWGAAAQWAWFGAVMGLLWAALSIFIFGYRWANATINVKRWPLRWFAAELIPVIIVLLGCWILFKFSGTAKRVLQNRDGAVMTESFRWLHNFFRMLSLGMIVALALMITLGLVLLSR